MDRCWPSGSGPACGLPATATGTGERLLVVPVQAQQIRPDQPGWRSAGTLPGRLRRKRRSSTMGGCQPSHLVPASQSQPAQSPVKNRGQQSSSGAGHRAPATRVNHAGATCYTAPNLIADVIMTRRFLRWHQLASLCSLRFRNRCRLAVRTKLPETAYFDSTRKAFRLAGRGARSATTPIGEISARSFPKPAPTRSSPTPSAAGPPSQPRPSRRSGRVNSAKM